MSATSLPDSVPRARAAARSHEAAAKTGMPARVVLRYAVLVVGALVMIAPFVDLVLGALRTPVERLARPPIYMPATPQWDHFATVFEAFPLLRWIGNSLLVTTSITLVQLATSVSAGFALAKYRFAGRDLILRFVVAAQLFPFFLLMIPLVFILRYWPLAGGNDWLGQGGTGLMNSYAALILPFAVSWYGIFLMRQYIVSIPDELLDAARLDGAGELRILWSVVLPMVRPALATLAVFVFVYHWNEVIWTLTVTRGAPDLQTAPIGIHLIRGAFENEREQSLQQAAVLVTILPVAMMFLALQRVYARAVTAASAPERESPRG